MFHPSSAWQLHVHLEHVMLRYMQAVLLKKPFIIIIQRKINKSDKNELFSTTVDTW